MIEVDQSFADDNKWTATDHRRLTTVDGRPLIGHGTSLAEAAADLTALIAIDDAAVADLVTALGTEPFSGLCPQPFTTREAELEAAGQDHQLREEQT